jgi:hypothetical protein
MAVEIVIVDPNRQVAVETRLTDVVEGLVAHSRMVGRDTGQPDRQLEERVSEHVSVRPSPVSEGPITVPIEEVACESAQPSLRPVDEALYPSHRLSAHLVDPAGFV